MIGRRSSPPTSQLGGGNLRLHCAILIKLNYEWFEFLHPFQKKLTRSSTTSDRSFPSTNKSLRTSLYTYRGLRSLVRAVHERISIEVSTPCGLT